jgi:hypothetical protein
VPIDPASIRDDRIGDPPSLTLRAVNHGLWSGTPRRVTATIVALAVVALACSLVAPRARAGVWMQVSCRNPNGSAASSAGWSGYVTEAFGAAGVTTACTAKYPMVADLSDDVPEPVGSGLGLLYTPPTGSTLVGGQIGVVLSATGNGTDAGGEAEVQEPAGGTAEVRLRCGAGLTACSSSGASYKGEFTLPADVGGDLSVSATCAGEPGFSCVTGATNGAWALGEITSADLLLQNESDPAAHALRGTLLDRRVHGTAQLSLDATDAHGPGVYQVAVAIDGTTIRRTTPSTNHGQCASVGTDAATGALMFDAAQPCLTAVTSRLTIPTAGLPDGAHHLQVSVTDAASTTTAVLSRTIDTFNPQETPSPTGRLKPRFLLSWGWDRSGATLREITAKSLPADAQLAVSCAGPRCPSVPASGVAAADVRRLERGLRNTRLQVGDRLSIIVSAPHRSPVDVELTVRADRRPLARLVRAPVRHRRRRRRW